ncbi:MAG: zinc-ribbon domain-containing protein [Coriobacteriales bacterium]|jgi:predicted amidophosphoribosyltransferase
MKSAVEREDFAGGICWPCTMCNKCGRLSDKFKCPVCQTELDPDATVCPNCGAPVLPKPGQAAGASIAQPKAPKAPSPLG